MGAFLISPLPPVLTQALCAAGSLDSTGVTPLHSYSGPSRHRLVFDRFPGCTGYTANLLHRFLGGTRTASPVARHALVTVLPLPPRRSDVSHRSGCDTPCCLRPNTEGSASGSSILSRPPVGSLSLRPGDSLTIPWMALSVGSNCFISSTAATQATGLLTPPLVGLTPTEQASLRWTHSVPKT